MSPAFRAAGDSIEIDIFGVIGSDGVSAASVRNVLKQSPKAKSITVALNSAGGDVGDGLGIYDMLMGHPARVVVNIFGLAASIASIVACAGDEITMGEGGFLMIHNPSAGLPWGEAAELRRTAAVLEKIAERMVNIYAARTGRPRATILAEMNSETWFSAAEALEFKFIDAITAPKKMAAGGWDLASANFRNVPPELLLKAQRREDVTMKPYHLQTRGELHVMANTDRPTFDRLRAEHLERQDAVAETPWRFLAYAEMDFGQKAALYHHDRALFDRMRANPTLAAE